jgi:protein SCO1/2
MKLRLAVGLAALGALAAAACGGGGDRELAGITRDPAPAVDGVPLPDMSQGGQPFEFRASPGGLLLVYFGYTNCPHECPVTMAAINRSLAKLGDDADRVSVAMVTVDPERDTDVLADYVQGFVPGGHAIATDDIDTLRQFAEPFGVVFDAASSPTGDVEVGHSDYLFAVDDAGGLAITWPFGTPVEDLVGDIRQLLADRA